MEPIAYLGAPLRRWPVIIPFVLIAALVALLIPASTASAYPSKTWMADAEVGLTPAYKANLLGAKVALSQIKFYAHSPVVLATAAKTAGVPVTQNLEKDVVVTKQKGNGGKGGGKAGGVLVVAVLQPTRYQAVTVTNAFVSALGAYTQVQLANTTRPRSTSTLRTSRTSKSAIASLPKRAKPVTPTTTPTTVPVKIKIKKVSHPAATTTTAAPTTTTVAHSLATPEEAASLAAFTKSATQSVQSFTVADPSTSAPTTTSIPGATTPTVAPGVPESVTPTTVSPTTISNRAVLEEERVLASDLGSAVAYQQRLEANGVPPVGLKVFAPATRSSAVLLTPSSSLLANDWVRLLLGLLIGIVIGVLATWLIDAFDRRIRTSKRAEEVFGLPVVVEVPVADPTSMSVIPVVDIIVDPYSATSESYRMLHVAILTAPPVTWVERGRALDEPRHAPPLRPRSLVLTATEGSTTYTDPAEGFAGVAATGGTGSADDSTAEMRLPVAVKTAAHAKPHRSRFSILVASPNDEPSRSLVVVNLAAVFAEAGDRVLVATTGNLRTEFEGNGRGPHLWEPDFGEPDASELVSLARPSQIPGVSSLALGQIFSNPSRLALKAGAFVEAARDIVDVVLLESPLLSTQDGAALLPFVDLVVVVCEAWHTKVSDAERTQRLLAQRRPPVLGVVMTNIPAEHATLLNG